MSSFNTVTKIKYTDKTDEPVTLNEYIVFQDDKSKRKYIVFRFNNNVTQQLLGMQFEVCQYNAGGDLIEKSIVVYNKFLAGAEEEFVPKAKLRVSYNCSTISVRLIQAAFDRFVWNEGEYKDNTYKFDMFYHDEVRETEEESEGKKPKVEKVKKQKREKTKKSKHPFVLKDATTKNLSKFPHVFNALVIIVVIAFVIGSLFIFKKDAKKFTVGDYLLRIVNDDDVAVYGYLGKESNLVIPEKIDGYNVTKIDGGAFKDSKITTLTIKGQVTVHEGAFVDCKNLKGILAEKPITVLEGAFRGCTAMKTSSFYYPKTGSSILDDDFIN